MSMTGLVEATGRLSGPAAIPRGLGPLLVFLLLVAGPAGVPAGLQWENPIQDFRLQPGAKDLETVFRFKNTGAYPVRIRRLRTSCGCLTARAERRAYAPGEAGAVEAVFKIGDRTGMQTKSILVETDDDDDPNTLIGMRVLIRSSAELSRRVLLWRRNGEPAPQGVTLDVLQDEPMKIARVLCSNPIFRTKVRTLEKGRKYEVLVEPASTEKRATATIRILTDQPPERPAVFTVHARVK
jgi:hypothetical protein